MEDHESSVQGMSYFQSAVAQVAEAGLLQEAEVALECVGGGLALVGPLVEQLAESLVTQAPSKAHGGAAGSVSIATKAHVTLVTKSEWEQLHVRKQDDDIQHQLQLMLPTSKVISLGVQRDDATTEAYSVVLWPQGQQFRLRMKLPARNFYVRLSQSGASSRSEQRNSVPCSIYCRAAVPWLPTACLCKFASSYPIAVTRAQTTVGTENGLLTVPHRCRQCLQAALNSGFLNAHN